MSIVGLSALIGAGLKIIDKVIPDPAQKAEAQLKLIALEQSGDLAELNADVQLALGQMEINKAEAEAGPFRGGWRPFIGWTCGSGLAYQFVVRPLATWFQNVIIIMNDVALTADQMQALVLPSLDLSTLIPLVAGMLGLGAMRMKEKMGGLK